MSKWLLFHIGLPKTGTSSLQSFVRLNKEKLSASGLDYVEEVYGLRDAWKSPIVQTPLDFTALWSPILKQYKSTSNSLLISDENYTETFSRNPLYLQLLLDHFPTESLRIIVYLRRQDLHYESLYCQLVKSQNMTAAPALDDILQAPSEDKPYLINYDYAYWLEELAKQIGKENIVVRIFESEKLKNGNLYEDFVEALGLAWSDDYALPPKHINPSISNQFVDICRKANAHLGIPGSPHATLEQRLFTNSMIYIRSAMALKPSKTLFSAEQKQSVINRYKKGNEAIAKEFVGIEPPLFSENIDGYSSPNTTLKTHELEQTTILLHRLWYERLCTMDLPLLNYVRLRRAQQDKEKGVAGAQKRLFIHKLIHSMGKRLLRDWPSDLGVMETRLHDTISYINMDKLQTKTDI